MLLIKIYCRFRSFLTRCMSFQVVPRFIKYLVKKCYQISLKNNYDVDFSIGCQRQRA